MTLRESTRCGLCLCKAKISLFSSLSAAMGFVLADGGGTATLFELVTGVFALACGACALNQVQERDLDARMARTANRPIPSGRVRPENALALALFLILSGEGLLLATGSVAAALLGLAAVLWYNGLYTGLKRRSAFAAVPGALVGCLPPAMGWAAGGGSLWDPSLASLVFFFFMWQVPHFWLHLLACGEEYAEAGLPSLTDIFAADQLKRLTFQWVSAAAVSALFLGLFGPLSAPAARIGLLAASLWHAGEGVSLMARHEAVPARLFRRTNHVMLIVMMLAFLERGSGRFG
jgi:protoheme IX farnesyltransferase